MKAGVLLLAHGAPERVEDVEKYLDHVRGGRPGSAKVVEEVRHRYAEIGGSSPLLSWTRRQAAGLASAVEMPVFFGMRNWHPFIAEVMPQVRDSGVERLAAICLAPQYSELSVGLYIKRTEEAARAAGLAAEIVWAKTFHDEPRLIEPVAEKGPWPTYTQGPRNFLSSGLPSPLAGTRWATQISVFLQTFYRIIDASQTKRALLKLWYALLAGYSRLALTSSTKIKRRRGY